MDAETEWWKESQPKQSESKSHTFTHFSRNWMLLGCQGEFFFPTTLWLSLLHFLFQEVDLLRGQLGDRLSVELDTAPTIDLNRVLEEMRCQYETVLANNRRDVEEWFAVQVSTQSKKMTSFQTSALFASSNHTWFTDRGAESAAAVQRRAAARLPDRDPGTETHSQCSGNWAPSTAKPGM